MRLFLAEPSRSRLAYFALALGAAALLLRFVQQTVFLDGRADLFWDFGQYYHAALDVGRGINPYRDFMRSGGSYDIGYGFNYPPLVAQLVRPLTLLTEPTAYRAWAVMNYLLVAIAAVAVWLTLRGRAGRGSLALLGLASLIFLPLYQGLYLGNLHILLLALLACAALALRRGRPLATAAILGVGMAVKVLPVLTLPVLLSRRAGASVSRRQWGYILALALAAAALLALPWTSEYVFQVLPRLSRKAGDLAPGGLSYGLLVNESLPGALARAEILLANHRLALVDLAGTLVSMAMFTATCVVAWRRGGGDAPLLTFASLVALIPIVSTITWAHHLVLELLVIALLLPHLHGGSRITWAVVVSYPMLLVSKATLLPLIASLGLAHPAGIGILPFMALTSLNLVGMVILWGATLATSP